MRAAPRQGQVLFYDADCGLCRAAARLVTRANRGRAALELAPLGGEAFCDRVTQSERSSAPDSVLVKTADQRLLARSSAVLFTLRQLGPPWSALARIASLVPRRLRDRAYDAIARHRRRLTRRA